MAADFPELGKTPLTFGASQGSSADASASEPHDLAGQIGDEIAQPLTSALERVRLLAESGRIGKRSLRALEEEIERARKVALTGQQIGRLASGRIQPDVQRIDLPQHLRDLLDHRSLEIEARGLEVRQVLKPALVLADRTLLSALLNTLLDWAFEHCTNRLVHVVTDLRNWPVRVQLVCEFAWRPADEVESDVPGVFGGDPLREVPKLNDIDWRLLERLAQTMSVGIERSDSPWQARVLFEFEQAVNVVEPSLSAPSRTVGAVSMAFDPAPMSGHLVLVVSPRREVRNQIREAVRPMGLMVDYVTSVEEAREFCRGGLPHGVIFDETLPAFEALRLELLTDNPQMAMLQISDDVEVLDVLHSGSHAVSRVGVGAIVDALPAALAHELSRMG